MAADQHRTGLSTEACMFLEKGARLEPDILVRINVSLSGQEGDHLIPVAPVLQDFRETPENSHVPGKAA